MRIDFAHVNIQGIDCAIFAADSRDHSESSRSQLLSELTYRAVQGGLRVSKSALAYRQGRSVMFYGTPDLTGYLANNGCPSMNRSMDV